MSRPFTSDGQSIGASASASVLPMNIQVWFPLGLTDLISLLSHGLSSVFSSTTVWKHQFFGAQPSLWSNSYVILLMGVCRCSGWCPVLEPIMAMVMAINILFLNKHQARVPLQRHHENFVCGFLILRITENQAFISYKFEAGKMFYIYIFNLSFKNLLRWTILKVFIEFVTRLLLYYVLDFWSRSTWDLSSLTRDPTCTLALEGEVLTSVPSGSLKGKWFLYCELLTNY